MKNFVFALILVGVVAAGLFFARRNSKPEIAQLPDSRPTPAANLNTERAQWEASPDGVKYLAWKASPEGQRVMQATAAIQSRVQDSSLMEAVVTALTLPAGSRLGLGIMVKIGDEDYILSFGPETTEEHQTEAKHAFKQLHTLQVNDRIKIRGGSVMHAPKYAYPIVSGDYVERNGVILYQRPPRQDGC